MRIPSEALPEAVEKVEPLVFAQKTDVHRWLAHNGHSATVQQTGPVNRARVDGRAPVWPTTCRSAAGGRGSAATDPPVCCKPGLGGAQILIDDFSANRRHDLDHLPVVRRSLGTSS